MDSPKKKEATPSTRLSAGRRPRWVTYALAVGATGATLAVRLGEPGWFGDRPVDAMGNSSLPPPVAHITSNTPNHVGTTTSPRNHNG